MSDMLRRLLRLRRPSKTDPSTGTSDLSKGIFSSPRSAFRNSRITNITASSIIKSLPLLPFWKPSWYSSGIAVQRRRPTPRLYLKFYRPWIIVAIFLTGSACLLTLSTHHFSISNIVNKAREDQAPWQILQPLSEHSSDKMTGPERWLRTHVNGKKGSTGGGLFSSRPRAAIISLVRNEELEGILQSMRELESHWNHEYHYPWIFFNEQPFSDKFKAATSKIASAATFYEVVPREHWSTPSWIDEERYMNSLDYLGTIGVGKGWMLSYRNMCRWNSGFFYKHPALAQYDYYWRVEPDVHFFCDIPYDPFAFLRDNNLIYGFNMNILDDARSFASLWRTTRQFMTEYPHLIHPEADLDWLLDPTNGGEYNNCQFFSNFEIGDLNFFRAEPNSAYFDFLDRSGGFYYERFGDAPVHTLSVSLFAPKNRVWFFRDIGYQHDIAVHCPSALDATSRQRRDTESGPGVEGSGRCDCEPTSLDENFFKLVPMESPQRKPLDTCIRQWLGGEWLDKKEGWTQEAERAFGGDGYGGYLKEEV